MFSLRSKITQAVLNYFFLNPKKTLYINEMARLLKVDQGNLSRKLNELVTAGLLKAEYKGNQRYYSLNASHPLLKHYKSIVLTTVGLEADLKKTFLHIKGIKQLIIFGSYVRNRLRIDSDIDLLVVGPASHLEIVKAILPLQQKTGRPINVVDLSEKEFQNKMTKKDPLLMDIFKKPLIQLI